MKRCRDCGKTKPLHDFYCNSFDGYVEPACKACKREAVAAWRASLSPERREEMRAAERERQRVRRRKLARERSEGWSLEGGP